MSNSKWDSRFISLAHEVAGWSKDPSTKVGTVIVKEDKTIVSVGYNGFPRGVEDSQERLDHRPTKYLMVVHAELNAIISAGEPLHGCTMYCTFLPCADCAGAAIQAGITRVVAPEPTDAQIERWGDSFVAASTMLREAGVVVDTVLL